MMKKILIFYTSVGLGHKFIAQNMGWHLERAGFEVKLADIGKVQEGLFSHIAIPTHHFINQYLPFLWGWMYRWMYIPIMPLRLPLASLNYKKPLALINEFQPDLVITVQSTASAVVAYLKKAGLYKNKFAIAFSDYHLHEFLCFKQADFYLANVEEQRQGMIKLGYDPANIYVCGISLKSKIDVNSEAVKQKFSIDASNKVILVGTGSLGLGFKQKDLEELANIPNVKIIFACGNNPKLLESVKKLNYPNLIPLGFYQPMDELYAIADIFVGKPGGLSTAESLQWNLPLMIIFTLPGQEDINYDYLVKQKLIIPMPKNIAGAIEQELHSGEFKNQLKNNPEVGAIINRKEDLINAIKGRLVSP